MEWSVNMGYALKGQIQPDIFSAYLLKVLEGAGTTDDVTHAANVTLSSAEYPARDITINAGVTVTAPSGGILRIMCRTLTIAGTLTSVGTGAAFGAGGEIGRAS